MPHLTQCNKSVEYTALLRFPSPHFIHMKTNQITSCFHSFQQVMVRPAHYNAPCWDTRNNSDLLSQKNGFSISLVTAPHLAVSLNSLLTSIKLFLQSKLLLPGLLKYLLSSKQRHSNMQSLCI